MVKIWRCFACYFQDSMLRLEPQKNPVMLRDYSIVCLRSYICIKSTTILFFLFLYLYKKITRMPPTLPTSEGQGRQAIGARIVGSRG